MRFTLRWLTATTLPTVMVRAARTDEQARPLRRQLREPRDEDARERREGGRLDGDGHERGHDRGRALVDVGRPGLERDQRHLEAEADQQERHAEQHERLERPAGDRVGDHVEPRAAGGAVEERHAVEQEPARERAEQEVLHRRLVRAQVAAQQPRQHVDPDRHVSRATKTTIRSLASARKTIPAVESRTRV